MLLDGYYHLCQAILCTVRIVSQRIQFTYTSRHTYGLARVGVVGELVAFISFFSLSISVFLESIKHLVDVIFVIPERETNSSTLFTAHGHEHIHSLIDHPRFILSVGIYATLSNCLLGVAILYAVMKSSHAFNKQLRQRRPSLHQPLPKKLLSDSLLITDTLPIQHSFLQVLNMLLGPLAILACGILLIMLSEKHQVRVMYSRLVDPIICCFLFLSYLIMISVPIRDVIHLVLQAKPYGLKSDDIETSVIASVPGVVKLHELHIWRLTPQKTLATVHVVFNTTENILTKYRDINYIFEMHHIDHVTIQPEFALGPDETDKLDCRYQCCEQSKAIVPNKCVTITPRNSHFHRRSSVGLPAADSDSLPCIKHLITNISQKFDPSLRSICADNLQHALLRTSLPTEYLIYEFRISSLEDLLRDVRVYVQNDSNSSQSSYGMANGDSSIFPLCQQLFNEHQQPPQQKIPEGKFFRFTFRIVTTSINTDPNPHEIQMKTFVYLNYFHLQLIHIIERFDSFSNHFGLRNILQQLFIFDPLAVTFQHEKRVAFQYLINYLMRGVKDELENNEAIIKDNDEYESFPETSSSQQQQIVENIEKKIRFFGRFATHFAATSYNYIDLLKLLSDGIADLLFTGSNQLETHIDDQRSLQETLSARNTEHISIALKLYVDGWNDLLSGNSLFMPSLERWLFVCATNASNRQLKNLLLDILLKYGGKDTIVTRT
ncbi:unnamed protein product [Adineta steineri]|uniref:Cation efflux protein cytoplasmic domain-containing protein n=1 Tax=Adineta steineri TaxID=433720 RepID=A0A814DMB7_9BILA|nr:unnamed protein product [Adineta steineri]